MLHDIKIASNFFADVVSYNKRFEIRRNDRAYKVGDLVHMHEISSAPRDQLTYTGATVLVKITYILDGSSYLDPEFIIFSFDIISTTLN